MAQVDSDQCRTGRSPSLIRYIRRPLNWEMPRKRSPPAVENRAVEKGGSPRIAAAGGSCLGNRAMRLRFFGAAYEPIEEVSVRDVGAYGTGQGFRGQVAPGLSTTLGLAIECGLNQRWVLALDIVQNYANGNSLDGTNAAGGFVRSKSGRSMSYDLAPAIEYSWSNNSGIIVGAEFSAAGRNTSSYVAPQIALNLVF
jgi:hypothetical protein